jgi:hypothetical protein
MSPSQKHEPLSLDVTQHMTTMTGQPIDAIVQSAPATMLPMGSDGGFHAGGGMLDRKMSMASTVGNGSPINVVDCGDSNQMLMNDVSSMETAKILPLQILDL